MGFGIAEVHEDAVAHVLRYEPAEPAHRLRDALLIGGDHLAEVFRGHAGRQCCRTDEVREHHGDLAALGSVLCNIVAFQRGCGNWRWCARLNSQSCDGIEQLTAMPDKDDTK